jgi:hypothetical protein
VAKVYVNRLELSVAENLLASADGTIGASNDSCLQLKHSSSGSAPRKTTRLPPVATWPARSSLGSYQVWSELSQ